MDPVTMYKLPPFSEGHSYSRFNERGVPKEDNGERLPADVIKVRRGETAEGTETGDGPEDSYNALP